MHAGIVIVADLEDFTLKVNINVKIQNILDDVLKCNAAPGLLVFIFTAVINSIVRYIVIVYYQIGTSFQASFHFTHVLCI